MDPAWKIRLEGVMATAKELTEIVKEWESKFGSLELAALFDFDGRKNTLHEFYALRAELKRRYER